MKILQIFGWVVAVHVVAFVAIFASPGCQSGPRNIPTPDATVPAGGTASAPVSFNVATPQPVDLGTDQANVAAGSHAAPTRPGSANAVAITPPKPTADVTSIQTYTVGRGDSLWTIAKKHNLTVAEIAKANNISAGVALQPGKKLIIPLKAGAAPVAADKPRDLGTLTQATPPKPAAHTGASMTHTVAVGESLSVIARKYGITLGELVAANSITDPAKVRAGQQLTIPGFKAVVPKGGVTSGPAPKSSPATAPAESPAPTPATPASNTPHFELAPPPPGQDLDAGLKDAGTEVPTIKVEETTPPKN